MKHGKDRKSPEDQRREIEWNTMGILAMAMANAREILGAGEDERFLLREDVTDQFYRAAQELRNLPMHWEPENEPDQGLHAMIGVAGQVVVMAIALRGSVDAFGRIGDENPSVAAATAELEKVASRVMLELGSVMENRIRAGEALDPENGA